MKHPENLLKISPLAAAITATITATPIAVADEIAKSSGLEEIIVTSRKRAESVMDIPASIQALSENDLKEMGARGIADYTRFMPAVDVIDRGPFATVVFRGATNSSGYVGEATSSVYLDEISLTTAGQQPSLRVVDVERVEALEGPQGTLYGADAMAGTLRYILNKPQMGVTSMTLDGSVRNSSEGEASYDGSVVVNLPIGDNIAARFVAFDAKDGGFIDNVPGKTIDNDTKAVALYGRSPSGWGTMDNSDVVEKDINDYNIDGWRAAVRWEINDQWAATASYINQSSVTGSYNGFDPNVGDLETIRYNEEYFNVDIDVSSLVVEGDLGFAQLVSATSYYDSKTDFDQDITNYHKSYSAYYCIEYEMSAEYHADSYYYSEMFYTGTGAVYSGVYCNAPTVEGDYFAAFQEDETAHRFSQEVRLSAEGDTLDWLVGAFYETSNYSYVEHWGYPTANENGRGTPNELYQQTISLAWNEWTHEDTFPDATENWYANSSKDTEQTAIFGEVTWHYDDRTDITFGARYFDRSNETTYFEEHPTGNLDDAGVEVMPGEDQKFVPKLAISYDLDDDNMVYALMSVGYRPGGINRQRGEPAFPRQYDPDKMTNYEVGFKGYAMDGDMKLDITAYRMEWSDYQFELIDPSYGSCPDGEPEDQPGICGQPYQVGVYNAGDAYMSALSASIDWNVNENFNVGLYADYQKHRTKQALELGDMYVEADSQLPYTPEWSGGLKATYNWAMSALDAEGYVRFQWSYTGSRLSKLEATPFENEDGSWNPNPQWNDPSYNIADLSVGIIGDDWDISLFLNNITDERAYYYHIEQGGYTQQNLEEGRMHVDTVYTNRPREFGVRFVKQFSQ